MTTVYITAFKDIGRGSWNVFTASTEFYVHHFLSLCQMCPRLVCFVEPDMIRMLKKRIPPTCMLLQYDAPNTFLRYESVEAHIMNTPNYKTALKHRLHHPEHCKPTYNLVNHNKLLFIRRVAKMLPNFDFYAWVDFHYARHFDTNFRTLYLELPKDKITIASFNGKDELVQSKHPLEIAIESKDIIQGSTFIVPSGLVHVLYNEYEQQVLYNYSLNVADDDQNIHLAIVIRRPELYNLVVTKEWGKFYSRVK